MSLRKVDAYCPDCQKTHPIEVEVAEPQVREIIKEDTARVDGLTREISESRQSLDALRGEVQRWQSGENHLQATDMLNMLQTCPNCRPALDAFVGEVRKQALANLTPDQAKEIARFHKLWPPPPIDLTPGLSRKAR